MAPREVSPMPNAKVNAGFLCLRVERADRNVTHALPVTADLANIAGSAVTDANQSLTSVGSLSYFAALASPAYQAMC